MGWTFGKYEAGSNDWQLRSFFCQMVSWATTGPGFPGAINTIIQSAQYREHWALSIVYSVALLHRGMICCGVYGPSEGKVLKRL